MAINSTFFRYLFLGYFVSSAFATMGQGRLTPAIQIPNGYEYVAYLPNGYDESLQQNWPVLIYLHGGQGIVDGKSKFGDLDNPDEGLSSFTFGIPTLIHNKLNGTVHPPFAEDKLDNFIIIVPHLPRDPSFPTKEEQLWDMVKLSNLVNYVFDNHEVNPLKVYLSGISLGAKAVWDYAMLHPEIPAAIIPISGNAVLDNLCALEDVAIWAFHGDADGQVNPAGVNSQGRSGTYLLIDYIKDNCSAKFEPHLTKLLLKEHSGWDEVYDLTSGYNMYDWFLKFEKNSTSNVSPVVSIGGMDKKVLKEDFPITLYGNAFDPEGTTLSYNWEYPPSSDVEFIDDTLLVIESLPLGINNIRLTASDGIGSSADAINITVLEEADDQLNVQSFKIFDESGNEIVSETKNVFEINTTTASDEFRIEAQVPTSTRGVRWTLNENQNIKSTDVWSENNSTNGIYYFTFNNIEPWVPSDGIHLITLTPFENDKPLRNPGISQTVTIGINTPIILPVEFLDVSAKRTGNKISINWSTASEDGNDFFTIERSPTASDHFAAIGTLEGAGNSKQIRQYSFTDYAPLGGDTYYRIKQTDFDGKSDYSKIVKVKGGGAFEVALFPNPAERGNLFVRLSSTDHYSKVSVNIIDAIGNVVYKNDLAPEQLMKEEGYKLQVGSVLNPGLYFVIIKQGTESVQHKLIVK